MELGLYTYRKRGRIFTLFFIPSLRSSLNGFLCSPFTASDLLLDPDGQRPRKVEPCSSRGPHTRARRRTTKRETGPPLGAPEGLSPVPGPRAETRPATAPGQGPPSVEHETRLSGTSLSPNYLRGQEKVLGPLDVSLGRKGPFGPTHFDCPEPRASFPTAPRAGRGRVRRERPPRGSEARTEAPWRPTFV